MEPYYNMNPSDGRNCRNQMYPNCRASIQKPMNRPSMRQENKPCRNPYGNGNGRCNMQNNCQNRMKDAMVEVECECKITPKANCYKQDPMDSLGCKFPPVMAYVPWQQWGELYDADCGLMQGTIFKDLNYIFCGVRC